MFPGFFYCERYVCLESVDSTREGSCESQGSIKISGTSKVDMYV